MKAERLLLLCAHTQKDNAFPERDVRLSWFLIVFKAYPLDAYAAALTIGRLRPSETFLHAHLDSNKKLSGSYYHENFFWV